MSPTSTLDAYNMDLTTAAYRYNATMMEYYSCKYFTFRLRE